MEPTRQLVLAALDGSDASVTVLEAALRLGQIIGTPVEALHVSDGPTRPLDRLAGQAGVPLRRLAGPVRRGLLDIIETPEVVAMVIGARAVPDGHHPVGRTARYILEHTSKPIMVVPPEVRRVGALKVLLLPLEGTEASSRPVLEALEAVLRDDVTVVVLHVFTEKTLPRMLDRPVRDLEMLGKEFLTKHLPTTERIEFRSGSVASCVAEVCEELDVDLIVLSWSQDTSQGRAAIVRDVLASVSVPVLLLPTKADDRSSQGSDGVPS